MSINAIRRFYVEDHSTLRPPYYSVVDRTGYLPPKKFEVGMLSSDIAMSNAVTLATNRNTCELHGAHVFSMQGEKCEICDATTQPDVLSPEGELL
jgi:hypothetical protein